MSTQESKESGPKLLHTRARRRLQSLQCCRGYEVLEWSGKTPHRVAICPMTQRTVWVWQAHGNKSQGGPMMELEE